MNGGCPGIDGDRVGDSDEACEVLLKFFDPGSRPQPAGAESFYNRLYLILGNFRFVGGRKFALITSVRKTRFFWINC